MSRNKNSLNRNPDSNYFKPESHFDRVLLSYTCESEESLGVFEKLIKGEGAIIKERPYAAVKKLKEPDFRNRASEKGISHIHKFIPPQDQEDVKAVSDKLLRDNDQYIDQLIFEWRKEGWLYIYFCNGVCLYVGETQHYPVNRATEHLDQPKGKFGKRIKSCQHNYQGWYIKWLDLSDSDCETLIRKSLILPGEDTDAHMQQMEEEFQKRNRTHPQWWRKHAELVLRKALNPLDNPYRE